MQLNIIEKKIEENMNIIQDELNRVTKLSENLSKINVFQKFIAYC